MTADLLRLFLWFGLTLIIGWSVLVVMFRRRRRALFFTEKAALSYGLGLGLVSIELAFLSLFAIRLSIFSITAFWAPLFVIAALIAFRDKVSAGTAGIVKGVAGFSLFEKFLASALSFEIIYAFFRALIKPIESYDSVAIYALKSKIFYLAGGVPRNFFAGFKDLVPHIEYPMLLPLAETYLYVFLGSLNDLLVKAIFPLYYVSILAIFYAVLRRFMARRSSLLFTFLLATVPQFADYASIGYADMSMAFYYSASFFYLFLGVKKKESPLLVLSFLLSVLGVWTKTEGLMLGCVNAAIAFFYIMTRTGARSRSLVYYVWASCISMAAYVMGKKMAGIPIHGDFVKLAGADPGAFLPDIKRVPRILYEYQRQFFGPKKWNIVWILMIFGFAANLKKAFSGDLAPVTLSILFALSGYAFIYMLTPQDIGWQLSTTASRFFIHILPLGVLWLAFLCRDTGLEI